MGVTIWQAMFGNGSATCGGTRRHLASNATARRGEFCEAALTATARNRRALRIKGSKRLMPPATTLASVAQWMRCQNGSSASLRAAFEVGLVRAVCYPLASDQTSNETLSAKEGSGSFGYAVGWP